MSQSRTGRTTGPTCWKCVGEDSGVALGVELFDPQSWFSCCRGMPSWNHFIITVCWSNTWHWNQSVQVWSQQEFCSVPTHTDTQMGRCSLHADKGLGEGGIVSGDPGMSDPKLCFRKTLGKNSNPTWSSSSCFCIPKWLRNPNQTEQLLYAPTQRMPGKLKPFSLTCETHSGCGVSGLSLTLVPILGKKTQNWALI